MYQRENFTQFNFFLMRNPEPYENIVSMVKNS